MTGIVVLIYGFHGVTDITESVSANCTMRLKMAVQSVPEKSDKLPSTCHDPAFLLMLRLQEEPEDIPRIILAAVLCNWRDCVEKTTWKELQMGLQTDPFYGP